MALATNLRPSMTLPSASLTPVARPLLTTISFTSAPVMTSPPPASTTRVSAFTSDTAPPTGSVKLAILAKIAGNTMPAPATFSVVMTCI